MASSTDIITINLPHPILTSIYDSLSDPTFTTIYVIQLQLNTSAASIHSNEGDSHHGRLTFTIPTTKYNTLSAWHFPLAVPINPSMQATNPAISTSTNISEINCQH
jgi:hypothetical protein